MSNNCPQPKPATSRVSSLSSLCQVSNKENWRYARPTAQKTRFPWFYQLMHAALQNEPGKKSAAKLCKEKTHMQHLRGKKQALPKWDHDLSNTGFGRFFHWKLMLLIWILLPLISIFSLSTQLHEGNSLWNCESRWLSLEKVLAKLSEQWENPKEHFINQVPKYMHICNICYVCMYASLLGLMAKI